MTELGLNLSFSQYIKISTAIAYDVEKFKSNFSTGDMEGKDFIWQKGSFVLAKILAITYPKPNHNTKAVYI